MECEKNVIIMTVFWLGYLIHSLDNRAMTFLTDTCLSTHTDAVYKVKTSLRITCYQIMPSSNSAYQIKQDGHKCYPGFVHFSCREVLR